MAETVSDCRTSVSSIAAILILRRFGGGALRLRGRAIDAGGGGCLRPSALRVSPDVLSVPRDMVASDSSHANRMPTQNGAGVLRPPDTNPERRLLLIGIRRSHLPAALIFGTDDVAGWATWGGLLASGRIRIRRKYLLAWPPLWLPYYVVRVGHVGHDAHSVLSTDQARPDRRGFGTDVFFFTPSPRSTVARPWKTALAYAVNPISIYCTAIHGQSDAIPTLCATVAVVMMGRRGEVAAADRAGVWLGIAAYSRPGRSSSCGAPCSVRSMRRQARSQRWPSGSSLQRYCCVAVLRFQHVTGVLRYRGAAGWWD